MGRDLWGSPGPCPCSSRATQSHLPNLLGCMASKASQSCTAPTTLLWCRVQVRSSEPHCWSERSSHLARPMDHRSTGIIFKAPGGPVQPSITQLQLRYTYAAFSLQPHSSWERDSPPKSSLKDAPGALALTSSASVTASTPAGRKPSPSLNLHSAPLTPPHRRRSPEAEEGEAGGPTSGPGRSTEGSSRHTALACSQLCFQQQHPREQKRAHLTFGKLFQTRSCR